MRRLVMLLSASALALSVLLVGGATPARHVPILNRVTNIDAHAVGTTCSAFDQQGVIYDDGYTASSQYDVGAPGDWHKAQTDLKAWRYTDPANGDCMRGYYTSTWITDQSHANVNDMLRVWACGQYAGDGRSYSNGNSWRAAVYDNFTWNGAMGYAKYMWVSDVWPSGGYVFFINYGTAPCGRQVDNFYSSACKTAWAQCLGPVVNGGAGYLNEHNL